MIEVRKPKDDEMSLIRQLRYKVLDAPLNLPERTVPSENDAKSTAIHMAAFDGKSLVSCVRLDMFDGKRYLVRRMATSPNYQGMGIGKMVMNAAEDEALKRGITKMILFSRKNAVGFYQKLGYTLTGKNVIHEGAENVEMVKDL